jgi:hypothetical protein
MQKETITIELHLAAVVGRFSTVSGQWPLVEKRFVLTQTTPERNARPRKGPERVYRLGQLDTQPRL